MQFTSCETQMCSLHGSKQPNTAGAHSCFDCGTCSVVGGGSFSNTDFGSFSNTDVLDHFRTQSGSFSNTWGGYPAARGGWGGAVAFASYCVPIQLRPGAGGRGQPGGSESQVTLTF